MNIIIVGTGAVSSVICKTLGKEKNVKMITCVAYDDKAAKKYLADAPKNVKVVHGDARKLDPALAGVGPIDLIINASLPDFNLDVMKSALRAKSNYQDLCSLLADLKHAEQLSLNREFRKAGLVALINTGVAPGLSNIMAAGIADELGEMESMEIITLEKQETETPITSWSAEVTVDEISAPPLVFRNGKFAFSKPFANPGTFRFPGKIGAQTVYDLYGDEISTVPLNLPVRNMVFRAGGDDVELAKTVWGLGLLSEQPVAVGNSKVVPRKFLTALTPPTPTPAEMSGLVRKGVVRDAVFALSVRASGGGRTVTKHAVFPDIKAIEEIMPGATYISYPTGLAASEFALRIPDIEQKGVIAPESLSAKNRNSILSALRRKKVRFSSTK